MKKSKAIWTIVIIVVAILGFGALVVFGGGQEKIGAASDIKLGLDLAGGVSITYQAVGDEAPSDSDMSDTVYKLQKRVEEYSTEAQVYKEGSDRISIEIPGVDDANAVLEELGKPGSLYFIKQYAADGSANYDASGNLNKTIDELIEEGSIVLEGTDVKTAQSGAYRNDMDAIESVVELTLTDEGTKKFADATTEAVVNHDSIMIYYDGEAVSIPTVQSAITGGQAQITGMADADEADKLASTIRIGGLKLSLEELRSNVVGAQLGSEAISTSIKAGIIGFALVVVFMIAVYLVPGLCASIALCLYIALVMFLLWMCSDAFGVTLTLPGIAGIILSVGMAVDANVITFARIREEIAAGKTVGTAIKLGYEKAFSAILDGNLTTLIAAAVLGMLGTGSIRGFSITLAIGIVVSMFTALFVTQKLLLAFFTLGVKDEKFYGKAKTSKGTDFLGKRKIFIAISLVAIIAGFVVMGVNGASGKRVLNFSLEFLGGTSTNVNFDKDMSVEEIDASVTPIIEKIINDSNVQVQKVSGSNQVVFKTKTLDGATRTELANKLEEEFGITEDNITSETISSTISDEMQRTAVIAVIVATVFMLLYIWFRFKDIKFGFGSILALCHDVLVVLAFYAFSRVSVGNTFIACMLTIVGYSINATIVIYDRIREEIRLNKYNNDEELGNIVNNCINQTLSRSLFTSLTTFIMVAVLYILGVSSIREFALPLMVGIICGCYSSVCLASAFWYIFKTKIKATANK